MTFNKEENLDNPLDGELQEMEPTTDDIVVEESVTEEMGSVDAESEMNDADEIVAEDDCNDEQVNELTGEERDALTESLSAEAPKDYTKLKKTILMLCVAAVVIAGGVFGYMKYDTYSKSYALTFDGVKYSVEDVKLFMLFQQGAEGAKEKALDALKDSLIIKKQAQAQGIELIEIEKTQNSDSAKNLIEGVKAQGLVMPNVTEERLNDIVSVNMYFTKLMAKKTKELKIDEADFKKSLEDYIQNNKQDYVDIQLNYIVVNTAEDAEKAKAKLNAGQSFDKAMKEFSIDYNPTEGPKLVSAKQLNFNPEEYLKLAELKVNEVSDVVDLQGAFAIFKVNSIVVPSEEQITTAFKEQYTQNKVFESLQADLEKWRKEAKFEVNQKAMDAIQ